MRGAGVEAYSRVLKQAVERVEHLVRQEEEELAVKCPAERSADGSFASQPTSSRSTTRSSPRQSSIIQPILSIELDHQPLLQIIRRLPHDLGVGILKDVTPANLDVALSGRGAESRLRTEVDKLATEVALVLRDVLVEGGGETGVVPGGRLGAVTRREQVSLRSTRHKKKENRTCDRQSRPSQSRSSASPSPRAKDRAAKPTEAAPSSCCRWDP